MNKLNFPETKMSFFGVGNPFATEVGKIIEQATGEDLVAVDWALNLEICDMINKSSEAAKDAVKAIRKRLNQAAGKNYTVVMYTLTVLETCVKNCGRQFHALVCTKEFVGDMVKLIGPKNDPPTAVQEKVLNLIRCWAETFRTLPDLQGVVQVYQELKTKGVEFPAADLESMAPIITPQRSVVDSIDGQPPSSPTRTAHSPVRSNSLQSSAQLTEAQSAKLRSDLTVVEGNMSVMSDMLNELTVMPMENHQEDDLQLLEELAETIKDMQSRVAELVARVAADEALTTHLLTLNDHLNSLLLRHQRFNRNRSMAGKVSSPSTILGAAIGVPPPNNVTPKDDDALIDLSDDPPNISKLSIKDPKASGDATQDEFDMLAQSRNDGGTTNTTTNKQANVAEMDQREIDEIAAWLDQEKQANESSAIPESVTSSDFEKFLAERAAAAENLPNVSGASTSNENTNSPRHKQKEEIKDSMSAM